MILTYQCVTPKAWISVWVFPTYGYVGFPVRDQTYTLSGLNKPGINVAKY